MKSKNKRFADDGWAIWVDGEDTSTFYLNDWITPKGKSFVDIAVNVKGMDDSEKLNIYIPFSVNKSEIDDVSLGFKDERLLRAIFSSMCIVDYKKNQCISEIAYNGKTVDVVHISAVKYNIEPVETGSLFTLDFNSFRQYLDNDEAYFFFRVPHKSVDDVVRKRANVGNFLARLRDLITTPIVSERYGYSVRINEARRLPKAINSIGSFHRQKLRKAIVLISIADGYELNDSGCYRIRRMEEDLYKDFAPPKFNVDDAITYQWIQTRNESFKGNYSFYFNISRDAVSKESMFLYMVLFTVLNLSSNMLWDVIKEIFGILPG